MIIEYIAIASLIITIINFILIFNNFKQAQNIALEINSIKDELAFINDTVSRNVDAVTNLQEKTEQSNQKILEQFDDLSQEVLRKREKIRSLTEQAASYPTPRASSLRKNPITPLENDPRQKFVPPSRLPKQDQQDQDIDITIERLMSIGEKPQLDI